MAKKTSFTDKKPEELQKLLIEKREELRVHRFASAGSRPKDSSAGAKTRKDIARILTQITVNDNASNA